VNASTGPISTRRITQSQKDSYLRFRAQGLSQSEAARRAGFSERAAREYEHQPGNEARIAELREKYGPPDAVDMLRGIMNDERQKTADRIAAAKALMTVPMIPDDAADDPERTVVGGEIHVHFPEHMQYSGAPETDAAADDITSKGNATEPGEDTPAPDDDAPPVTDLRDPRAWA
jgi:hypothetical protein